MRSKRNGKRVGWWLAAAAAATAALAGLWALAAFLGNQEPGRASDAAQVLSLLVACAALAGPLIVWLVRRGLAAPPQASEPILRRLRRAGSVQWSAEVAARQLHSPRPLRLRWRPTGRAVQVSAATVAGSATEFEGQLLQDPRDTRPPATALAAAFHDHPQRQLVILGEPGAGKTTLAILYTLAAIDNSGPDGPVPVLLSVAGWDPVEPLQSWLTNRIMLDYPQLAGRSDELAALLADRLVVPVLDGLDEMPGPRRPHALRELDRAAATGLRMVLTCRSDEFQHTVDEAGALALAAVIDVEPVRIVDAEVYLTQREVSGSQRWQPVLEAMRRDPDGPLATALSTPLMIGLARRVYQAPQSAPQQLVALATAKAVERHLLEGFLPSVYPDPAAARRASRWLAFLAHHCRDRMRDPNLEWWRLARAAPRAALVTLTVALFGVLVGIPMAVALVMAGEPVAEAVFVATVVIVPVGLVLGVHGARIAHAPPSMSERNAGATVLTGVLLDLRAIAVLVLTGVVIPLALVGLILMCAEMAYRPAAIALNNLLLDLVDQLRNDDGVLLSGTNRTTAPSVVAAGVALLAVANAQAAGRASAPRLSAPRLRDLPSSLAVGLGVALILGIGAAALIGLGGDNVEDMVIGGLLVTALAGIHIALGRWLGTPAEHDAAASPEALLRGDRTTLLVAVGGAGASMAGVGAALAWFMSTPATVTIGIAVVFMTLSAVLVLFGSGAPWLPYTLARLWLMLRRRLPWRLTRFLKQAHAAGVLRQAGPAYQFRHDLLRGYLADTWQPSADVPRQPRGQRGAPAGPLSARLTSRHRQVRLVGVGLAIALALTVVSRIEPSIGPVRMAPLAHGVAALAISSGGTVITSAHVDRRGLAVDRYRLKTDGRPRRLWLMPEPTGFCLTMSNDGSKVATCAPLSHDPRRGSLMNVESGTVSTLPGAPLRAMALDPDGRSLATVDVDNALRLWPLHPDAPPVIVAENVGDVLSVAVSANSPTIVTGDRSGQLVVRNLGTGAVRTLAGDGGPVYALEISLDGRTVLSTDDRTYRVWDVAGGVSRTIPAWPGGGGTARLSPDGRTIVTVDRVRDRYRLDLVRLWSATTGRRLAVLPRETDPVDALAFSADSRHLVTAHSYWAAVWDVKKTISGRR
ncbi:NACHT domain-containing protein [Micromonospora sp. NPDC005203]|uniref:NACHT and WD40 repeat domain-containing protein n=1 Tax=Micromonospora sp. NPDC005203 TaxID=3364226 RepID=UPI0036779E27